MCVCESEIIVKKEPGSSRRVVHFKETFIEIDPLR